MKETCPDGPQALRHTLECLASAADGAARRDLAAVIDDLLAARLLLNTLLFTVDDVPLERERGATA